MTAENGGILGGMCEEVDLKCRYISNCYDELIGSHPLRHLPLSSLDFFRNPALWPT